MNYEKKDDLNSSVNYITTSSFSYKIAGILAYSIHAKALPLHFSIVFILLRIKNGKFEKVRIIQVQINRVSCHHKIPKTVGTSTFFRINEVSLYKN
jgi:hypothetical protein